MAHFKSHSQGELCYCNDAADGVPSLVDASCLHLARNLNLTICALKSIPHTLYPVLLAASLHTNLAVCTKAVVASWPFTTLSFKTLQHFTNCKISSKKRSLSAHDHPALAVAMAMSECNDTKIQDIDITCLKLSEATEKTFLEILLRGRQTKGEPVAKKQRKQGGKQDKGWKELRVIMDLKISSSTAEQYFKLQRQLSAVNMSLRSKRLSVNQCGAELLAKVLKSVDKMSTTELDIGYNSLENSTLKTVLPHVQEFKAVTRLGLQYNKLDLRESSADSAIQALESALTNLSVLEHLKLTGNRLTGRVSEILRCIKQPLHGLDVSSCTLAADDISYLAGSHHAPRLQHLLLSNNKAVGQNWDAIERLLLKASSTLLELDLEDTSLGCGSHTGVAGRLAKLASSFQSLQALEIHMNDLSSEEQVGVVLAFVKCVTMRELRLSLNTIPIVDTWEDYKDCKLSRFSPHSELTVVPWFTISCLRKRAKMKPGPVVGRRPMNVYIYGEDCMIDLVTFEFPIS